MLFRGKTAVTGDSDLFNCLIKQFINFLCEFDHRKLPDGKDSLQETLRLVLLLVLHYPDEIYKSFFLDSGHKVFLR